MTTEDETEERIAVLEARVAAIEAHAGDPARTGRSAPAAHTGLDPETFWVVDGLAGRYPDDGTVVYAGRLDLPGSGPVVWQYGQATDDVLDRPWDELAPRLDALAHPVRLRLLRAVLRGSRTVAELLDELEGGTSGQLYHHLNPLVASGWLASPARGRYAVPVDRVVPLLALVCAVEGPR